LGDGGTKANASQQSQNQRLLGKINHVNSLSKNLDCVLYSQNAVFLIRPALTTRNLPNFYASGYRKIFPAALWQHR
ncbi:MAG: hypothetical protein ABTQ26_02785, partial [Azonexus sp.]